MKPSTQIALPRRAYRIRRKEWSIVIIAKTLVCYLYLLQSPDTPFGVES
jgi:hypothetical protein